MRLLFLNSIGYYICTENVVLEFWPNFLDRIVNFFYYFLGEENANNNKTGNNKSVSFFNHLKKP